MKDDDMKREETKQKEATNTATKKIKKPSASEEYKRRYFEYYDDIKISDRQDW